MSTRGSEAYRDNHWNLYHDVMEPTGEDGEKPLYLEIDEGYVETAGQDGLDVTVSLPPDLARIVRAGIAATGHGPRLAPERVEALEHHRASHELDRETPPCPCCGGAAAVERNGSVFAGQDYGQRYPADVTRQHHGYRIACQCCGLSTCWWHYAGEAMAAWSRRTALAASGEGVQP